MSRAERLLNLIEILRRHRAPVSGARLAEELGVSLRSLYRDIATLQGQGATIEGEAGVGYVLKPGFMLPPLMFSEGEIEAIVLGSRWVAQRGDGELSRAARSALAKILAVLPAGCSERGRRLDADRRAGQGRSPRASARSRPFARRSARERKLSIAYRDGEAARQPPHDLAIRARLFRPGAGRRRLVRTARGLPAFPHRPHRRARSRRGALSAPARGPAEGLARGRGHPVAIGPRLLTRF